MTTVSTRRSLRVTLLFSTGTFASTLAADLFHSDRDILVGHFALTITVQYPPSLKRVVLLEVNITGCNQRYCNSSPLVISILTLPATVEAQEDHYTRYYYAHRTVVFKSVNIDVHLVKKKNS